MKSLQVTGPGAAVVLDLPIPTPGPGEVLLHIAAVTTCPQWDLHLKHNEPMFVGHQFHYPYPPGQPGHEATGTIAAVGDGVTALRVGARVSTWTDPGHRRPGCYAEYVLLSAGDVIPVRPDLAAEATASVELAMCVSSSFIMLDEMNALRGKRIAVSGLGPAGLIAVQLARAEGAAEVIGLDFSETRRALAERIGATATYDPRGEQAAKLPSRSQPGAFDTGIDCVGARASISFLTDRTVDVVTIFGVLREEVPFGPRHWVGLRLCGYPGPRARAASYAVAQIERGALDLRPLVTHTLPMSRYLEGVALLERQEAIKICFDPSQ